MLQKFQGKFGINSASNKTALREMHLLKESKDELNRLAGELTIISKRAGPVAQAA